MAVMAVSIESTVPTNGTRRKPQLVCRGRMRKSVTKLLKTLERMYARDQVETARSTQLGYNPYLFMDEKGSFIDKAMQDLINQCYQKLSDRA